MNPCGHCPVCTGTHEEFHDRPKECDRVVGERLRDSMASIYQLLYRLGKEAACR